MSVTEREHSPTEGMGAAMPPRLHVVVDEATIDSTGWRTIDPAGAGPVVRGTRDVTARFGVMQAFSRNDNRSDTAPSGASASILPFPLVAANDAFGDIEVAPADVVPRLRRIYRPAVAEAPSDESEGVAAEPLRVMPLAADAPIGWDQAPSGAARPRRREGIDRATVPLLIGLMVLAWAVLLALGLYKGLTPSSGAPIKWSD